MPGAAFPIPTTWSDDDDDKEDRKSDKIRRKFDLETTGAFRAIKHNLWDLVSEKR